MGRLTNYQMSYLLSLKTHREKYPVVHWIESQIAEGKADSDFGEHCKEVIDEVRVHYAGLEDIDYAVEDGKVVSLVLGPAFFEDDANPTKEEFDLLEVVRPQCHRVLREFCEVIPEFFEHPHSCNIEYFVREEDCSGSGCERKGPVNYLNGKEWLNYCGGSPRCCP